MIDQTNVNQSVVAAHLQLPARKLLRTDHRLLHHNGTVQNLPGFEKQFGGEVCEHAELALERGAAEGTLLSQQSTVVAAKTI